MTPRVLVLRQSSSTTLVVPVKKTQMLGLALSGGGPTFDGYPTIFVKPREKTSAPKRTGVIRPVLTHARLGWLMRLQAGPSAWRRRRGKVQNDCMALGWTEWSRMRMASICMTGTPVIHA